MTSTFTIVLALCVGEKNLLQLVNQLVSERTIACVGVKVAHAVSAASKAKTALATRLLIYGNVCCSLSTLHPQQHGQQLVITSTTEAHGASSVEVYGFTAWITTGVAYGLRTIPNLLLESHKQLVTLVILAQAPFSAGLTPLSTCCNLLALRTIQTSKRPCSLEPRKL